MSVAQDEYLETLSPGIKRSVKRLIGGLNLLSELSRRSGVFVGLDDINHV